MNPKHFGILSTRANILYEIGDLDKAIKDQSAALELRPDNMYGYNARS